MKGSNTTMDKQIVDTVNELVKQINNLNNNQALNNLAEIIKLANQKTIIDKLLPFGTAIISTTIGTFLGYLISRLNERRKSKKDIYFPFLQEINDFLIEIHKIVEDSNNYNKLLDLCGIPKVFFYDFAKDHYINSINIVKFKKEIDSHPGNITEKTEEFYKYKDELYREIDRITDFKLINNLGDILAKKAMPYSLFIQKDLLREFESIYNELAKGSANNLRDFVIYEYRIKVINYIQKIKGSINKLM
jgi:hypothetical protein